MSIGGRRNSFPKGGLTEVTAAVVGTSFSVGMPRCGPYWISNTGSISTQMMAKPAKAH